MKGLSIVWSKSICISRCIIKKSVKFTHSSPKSPTSVKLLMVNLQSCYINRVNIHSYCSSFVYHYFNFFFLSSFASSNSSLSEDNNKQRMKNDYLNKIEYRIDNLM